MKFLIPALVIKTHKYIMELSNADNFILKNYIGHIKVQNHVCSSEMICKGRCPFCKVCGAFLFASSGYSLNSRPQSFLRSKRFSIKDPYCVNSNIIFEQLVNKQSINRYFNASNSNIQHRDVLIEWSRKICENLSYSLLTFHSSVAYIDSVFSLYMIKENQMKLIGFISIYLAAKMEEEDCKIPTVKQTVEMFKEEYSDSEIINCEKFVCKILNFKMIIY